jgi:uncharacterized membrane protein
VAQVQRTLERGLNPLLSLLPLCFYGTALLFDFGALLIGLPVFAELAHWVLTTAIVAGLISLTALLVDYTTAPVGSVAHRVRGLASASTSFMVVGFTLVWYLRGDGAGGGNVFVLELVAYLGGLLGSTVARSPRPAPGMFETRNSDGWPFTVTQ